MTTFSIQYNNKRWLLYISPHPKANGKMNIYYKLTSLFFVRLAHVTANESAIYPGRRPSKAVDNGNTEGTYAKGSVTATTLNDSGDAWWMVDLGTANTIGKVTIHNRLEENPDRLQQFFIELLDKDETLVSGGSVYRAEVSPSGLDFWFNNISAQFVRIRFEDNSLQQLSLDELFKVNLLMEISP
jgi:hypothetical protein